MANASLGCLIRTKRLRLGLTQAQLAARLGRITVNPSSRVSRIEHKGCSDPKLLRKLASALECPLSELKAHVVRKPDPMPSSELGKFIENRRVAIRLSRQSLSQRSGVSMETLRALLDRNTLTYDAARKLAQALKIGLSRFQVFYTSACRYRPTGSDLGAFVRQRRTHLGLAQADLAKALGVSKNAVSLIELGKFSMVETDPSPLAAALKVPPQELLKRLGAKKLARHTRDTALGQFLTSRRLELGLTLQALAEMVGTSSTTVHLIERYGRARLERLNRIAAALDVTIPRALLP